MDMNLKTQIRHIAIASVLLLASIPALSQDLLARQAPVDRRMRAVDTIMLRGITVKESFEIPVSDLYEGWDNKYAHQATELPERFDIDLRDFCMPTPSRVVTSNFGPRWGRKHQGIDLKVYIGDTIRAAFSGKVRIVRYDRGGYGNFIVIRHGNGLETIYGHLSKQLVRENDEVRAGDVIGLGGNTGRSTGSHLHFETRLCGVALNPALMFDFREQDVTGDFYAFNKATYEQESREANRLRGKIGNGSYTREQVKGTERVNTTVVTTSNEEILYHKVASGETLNSIAKRYGTTIEKLCKLNRISKKKRIRVGQILRYS